MLDDIRHQFAERLIAPVESTNPIHLPRLVTELYGIDDPLRAVKRLPRLPLIAGDFASIPWILEW